MTDPERLQAAVDEALDFLGRSGTQVAEREQLAKRVVDRGDAKVRKQLGDAIYDLARRCIQVHEKTRAHATFGARGPRPTSELLSRINPLSDRAAESRVGQALMKPSPESTAPLAAALRVLELLEGRTDSWRSLVAYEAMAREDWEASLAASQQLANEGSTEAWRRTGTQNAATALMRLDRFAEAERLLSSALVQQSPTDALLYNLACAHAMQGHRAEFEQHIAAMKSCTSVTASIDEWHRVLEQQAGELANATGQTPTDILSLFDAETQHE